MAKEIRTAIHKNDVTSTVPGKEMDCPTVDNREVYLGMPTNAIYCHHSLVVVGSPPSLVRTHDKDQQLCPHVLSCPHHAFVVLSQVVEEEGVCPFYEIHRATHTYTLQERMTCTTTTLQKVAAQMYVLVVTQTRSNSTCRRV